MVKFECYNSSTTLSYGEKEKNKITVNVSSCTSEKKVTAIIFPSDKVTKIQEANLKDIKE